MAPFNLAGCIFDYIKSALYPKFASLLNGDRLGRTGDCLCNIPHSLPLLGNFPLVDPNSFPDAQREKRLRTNNFFRPVERLVERRTLRRQ